MPCEICNDTGMTGYHKPMRGADGTLRMVFVPQLCRCTAGVHAARKYEQNLKEGRAGMSGIGDQQVTTREGK